jgi:hypothetical protein
MSTSEQGIVRLVKMLLRGIRTEHTIDPEQAAEHFDKALQTLDLMYVHDDAAGYILDGVEPVMFAEFTDDGVTFDEHHEHPKTLDVIHCALNTLTHMEMQTLLPDEDDSTDDFDWV